LTSCNLPIQLSPNSLKTSREKLRERKHYLTATVILVRKNVQICPNWAQKSISVL
jgi:hypothetical protein